MKPCHSYYSSHLSIVLLSDWYHLDSQMEFLALCKRYLIANQVISHFVMIYIAWYYHQYWDLSWQSILPLRNKINVYMCIMYIYIYWYWVYSKNRLTYCLLSSLLFLQHTHWFCSMCLSEITVNIQPSHVSIVLHNLSLKGLPSREPIIYLIRIDCFYDIPSNHFCNISFDYLTMRTCDFMKILGVSMP